MNLTTIIKNKGVVEFENGREFTRLVGGFGKDKPMITTKQIAELMGYENGVKTVNLTINRNINSFEFGLDIIDLKDKSGFQSVTEFDFGIIGLNKQSVANSKNIYALSQSGFLLYLKFAEGDKAIELYKNFIEDYFKIKVENKELKDTLQEQIDFLKEKKATVLGKMFMETDSIAKIELFNEGESLTSQIIKLEAQLQSKKDNEQIQQALDNQSKLTSSKDEYLNQTDFGSCFNLKIGSKMVGKLLKIVGLAMSSSKTTKPYETSCPKYAKTVVNQELSRVSYKWNYNECIVVIDKWLKDNGFYERFYSITNKEDMIEFVNLLYIAYVQ